MGEGCLLETTWPLVPVPPQECDFLNQGETALEVWPFFSFWKQDTLATLPQEYEPPGRLPDGIPIWTFHPKPHPLGVASVQIPSPRKPTKR